MTRDRTLTLEFTVKVTVKARNEIVPRGHWRDHAAFMRGRREDFIIEEVPPPTDAELIRSIRRQLNDMQVGTGVTTSDYHYEVAKITHGRKTATLARSSASKSQGGLS